MIKRQKEMSEYEYAQLDKMVYQLYLVYGKGLEFDECRSIAFLKYVEVRKELHDFYNEDLLWLYSKNRIIDAFKEAQREKNRQIRLEAKLSMNQLIGESGEPVYTILFPARGNFVNYVCLWHDMRQLGKMCYTILLALYWGSEDWEIVDCLKISAQAYFNIKDFLRIKLKAYVEI